MKLFSTSFIFSFVLNVVAGEKLFAAAETNSPPPITARDFFNAGTKLLGATNFAAAETMFLSALATQDEVVQPLAEFNLAHTRFAAGLELLKKGPDAQKVATQGNAALADGAAAIQNGETALAENQTERMVAAYLAGQGARRELRAAEKAVKVAVEMFGKTLGKWQRAADDFNGAAELNPADTNATHNAKLVEHKIAELVDMLQRMQEMMGQMAGQKQALGKMMSKLKGQIPAPNAPPGGKGESEDDDNDDGSGHDEVKQETLAGKQQNRGRNGDESLVPLSPEQAGQMLDGLSVDASRRLPMGGDQAGEPKKDQKGRNW